MLGQYRTGGVDVWQSGLARHVRSFARQIYPQIDAKLSRRTIGTVPQTLVFADWRWEAPRLAAKKAGFGALIEDWVWEHGEFALDRSCAERISRNEFDAFIGVEFGALDALTRARQLGKWGVVAFLSAHHATRTRWVDSEYERFPELMSPATKKLLEKGKVRDARRDQEAGVAHIIHCASRFTYNSLVTVGVPREKLIVAPLGCPAVAQECVTVRRPSEKVRFLYSGSASVQKGAHLLIDAWKKLRAGSAAELHFFGGMALPDRCMKNVSGIFYNGAVSAQRIAQEYRSASVLVFPTLCDGFGMVVAEAFANGLPVITTANAGAADLVRDGENGWVVPPRDVHALAERLQWCIDHKDALEDMRKPARETARQWTWEHFRALFITQLMDRLARLNPGGNAALANCNNS